ncbi:MAG: Y-family DNA polymerase [Glycocaulis sp.]
MRRFVCVWFPHWPMERLKRARTTPWPVEDGAPFVLTETCLHGRTLAAVNDGARALGLEPGLRFTDARARVPELMAEEIDREADHIALKRLTLWMTRFSPLTAMDGPDGIRLDVTGCAHLFGGEEAFLATMKRALEALGLTPRLGLADSAGAAWALSRFGDCAVQISGPGKAREALTPLPTSALRLEAGTVQILRRFGLTRIGQLYGIERTALARRFRNREAAQDVLLRLDQALGVRPEPLIPLKAPARFTARISGPEPLLSLGGIEDALIKLLAELTRQLEEAGKGARRFILTGYRSDGTRTSASLALSRPGRDAGAIAKLFAPRLEAMDPGFGIDLMTLSAHGTGPLEAIASALPDGAALPGTDPAETAALVDRLNARLGDDLVAIFTPFESHLPGRSEALTPFPGALKPWPQTTHRTGPRPLIVLDRPEPVETIAILPDGPPARFTWRRVTRSVARADGPERIGPEWWRGKADGVRARDYYRVEDEDGHRYWLMREGLYDDQRGGTPRWYVCGLFP